MTIRKLRPVDESPTQKVVLGAMFLGGVVLAFVIGTNVFDGWIGWALSGILTLALIYEGWTLVNDYEGDTISEIIWRLAKRPILPWIFGLGTSWLINFFAVKFDLPPEVAAFIWLILALGFLQGHFFFQEAKNKNGKREV